MSYEYRRVIPRDLFNEANLLKCYGQMWLNLERLNLPGAVLEQDDDGGPFHVVQHEESGATTLGNVYFWVNGAEFALHRPLNSRASFPLYLTTEEGDELGVFNDDGTFSADMLAFLKRETTSEG